MIIVFFIILNHFEFYGAPLVTCEKKIIMRHQRGSVEFPFLKNENKTTLCFCEEISLY